MRYGTGPLFWDRTHNILGPVPYKCGPDPKDFGILLPWVKETPFFPGPYCDPKYEFCIEELTYLGASEVLALKWLSHCDWEMDKAADTMYDVIVCHSSQAIVCILENLWAKLLLLLFVSSYFAVPCLFPFALL